MRVWKNLSKPKKAGIIIGAVAVVVAGAFLYRLLVQLPVTLDSGVRIQTIGNDERETAFRAFDFPLQEPATLTEIVDVESFREPYAYLYVEVDKDKNEAFETALLEHYERTDEPGYASQSGFFDHTEYASLTASDCVGRYVHSQQKQLTIESFRLEDTMLYVVRTEDVPSDLKHFVWWRVWKGNYLKRDG